MKRFAMQPFIQYLKSLFFNFLVVFFASHIFSGIEVTHPTQLPHIGGDLLFSLLLGLINSFIFPILKWMDRHYLPSRIALSAILINFGAFAALNLLPLGVLVVSLEGYLVASSAVSLGSFVTNYVELKRLQHLKASSKDEEVGS